LTFEPFVDLVFNIYVNQAKTTLSAAQTEEQENNIESERRKKRREKGRRMDSS